MEFWDILYYSDLFFFIFVCLTVVYMGLFAMASMFSHHQDVPKTRIENRFIIFIPAYKNGHSAEQTVRSILGQTYPQRLFDVTVIADQLDEMSNFRLHTKLQVPRPSSAICSRRTVIPYRPV